MKATTVDTLGEAPVGSTTSPSHDAVLELNGLIKNYKEVQAVRGVDLRVPRGEFVTLLGPSGSGKTTILRLIAGFVEMSGGNIVLDGRDVSQLAPAARGIGMVFQNYALFPHMTVRQNVDYGLRMRKWSRERRDKRIAEVLEVVGLAHLAERAPRELSGGQQQRVALARAVAFDPPLLLMDEPLGALDRELRVRMTEEIRRLHRELGATILYVTHDQHEALALSDRIAIMRDGLLEAVGSPRQLFTRPPSRFVATFFGGHNLIPAELRSVDSTSATVVCVGQELTVPTQCTLTEADDVHVVIPADAFTVDAPAADAGVAIDAQVQDLLCLGNVFEVICRLDGNEDGRALRAQLPARDVVGMDVGSRVRLYADRSALVAVD